MANTLIGKGRSGESKTLVDRLKEVENLIKQAKDITPNSISEEEEERSYKRVIEEFETNRFVYGAINGELNILEECKRILEKCGGKKNYYPHYISSKDMEIIRELEAIVGPFASSRTKRTSGLNNEASLFCNPVITGVGSSGLGGLVTYPFLKGREEKMNRRLFLKTIGTVLGYGFLGALCGHDASVEFLLEPQRVALENVSYVHTKILQLYKV